MYQISIYEGNIELSTRQGDYIADLIDWANKNMREGQYYTYFMFPSI